MGIYVASMVLFDAGVGPYVDMHATDGEHSMYAIFSILLLPIGWMLFQTSLNRLAIIHHSAKSKLTVLILLITLICILFAFGIYMFIEWEGIAVITLDESEDHDAIMVQSIYILLLTFTYATLLIFITVRALGYNISSSGADATPLLDDVQSNVQTASKLSFEVVSYNSVGGNSPLTSGTASGTNGTRAATLSNQMPGKNKNILIGKNSQESGICGSTFMICFYFGLFLPVLFILNGFLPSDWHRMNATYLLGRLALKSTAGWVTNIHYKWDNSTYKDLYYKIYWDMAIYYAWIFAVGILSWFSMKDWRMKSLLRQRVRIKFDVLGWNTSVTKGEILYWLLWMFLMIIQTWYWLGIHIYDTARKNWYERWARFSGILAILFSTFMLITVSRIRLWIDCFHISFEHLVGYHRFFAYCMIITSYIHLFFWMAYQIVKFNFLLFCVSFFFSSKAGPVTCFYNYDFCCFSCVFCYFFCFVLFCFVF